MRRDAQRLQDIVEAAEVLSGYLRGLRSEEFLAGGLAQDAILRQLTVVGEAAFKVSPELRERHAQIPWPKIIGFRHRLVHDYFGLDLDAVWMILTVEVPVLRDRVMAILAAEFPQEAHGPQD